MEIGTENLRALVLRAYDIKESSRMVDIFSRDLGRISFVARGAKRKGSLAINLSQPYVEGVYNLIKTRSSFYFKDGQIKDAHLGIRSSVEKLLAADLAMEILTKVVFSEADPNIYDMTCTYLEVLEEARKIAITRLVGAYVLKLVSFLGFRPYLNSCVECGKKIENTYNFSPEDGGMLCDKHALGPGIRKLNKEEYLEIVKYMGNTFESLSKEAKEEKSKAYILASRTVIRYFQIHTGIERLTSLGMLQGLSIL